MYTIEVKTIIPKVTYFSRNYEGKWKTVEPHVPYVCAENKKRIKKKEI